jgi:hypothetical protein
MTKHCLHVFDHLSNCSLVWNNLVSFIHHHQLYIIQSQWQC